jgi:hypothetical protein
MTAGPWRPVHLEIYDSRVADLWSQIEVSKDLRTASGKLYARIDGPSNKVAFTVKLREKIISQHETAVGADGLAEVPISIEIPSCGTLMDMELRPCTKSQLMSSLTNSWWTQCLSEQVYGVESSFRKMTRSARASISGSMESTSSVLGHAGFLLITSYLD